MFSLWSTTLSDRWCICPVSTHTKGLTLESVLFSCDLLSEMKPAKRREGESVKKTHFLCLWIMNGRLDRCGSRRRLQTFQFRLDTQSFLMSFDESFLGLKEWRSRSICLRCGFDNIKRRFYSVGGPGRRAAKKKAWRYPIIENHKFILSVPFSV